MFGGDTSYACSLGTYFHRTRAVALAVFVVIVKAAGFYSPVIIIIDGCIRIMTSSFNRLARFLLGASSELSESKIILSIGILNCFRAFFAFF